MKRLNLEFYHSFTNEFFGGTDFPYDKVKSMNGFYSKYWRTMKIGLANIYKVDKRFVRVRILKG